MSMAKVIEAFEKYERASSGAQQVRAKSSLEAWVEEGQGIDSPVNSLQRERANLQAAYEREEARAEFFKSLLMMKAGAA